MSKNIFIKRLITAFTLIILTGSVCIILFAFYKTITMFQGISFNKYDKKSIGEISLDKNNSAVFEQIEKDIAESKKIKQASKQINGESTNKNILNLELYGTIIGDQMNSTAIINNITTGKQSFCKIGDIIQGAKIKEIFRKKVLLSLNGDDYILSLKEKKRHEDEKTTAQSSDLLSTKEKQEAKNSTKSVISRELGDFRGLKNRDEVIVELSKLNDFSNPDYMNSQSEYAEQIEDSKIPALKITSVIPSSFYDLIGIKENDILVGVNGKLGISKDDLIRLPVYIKITPNFSIQVKRGDEIHSFDFAVKR